MGALITSFWYIYIYLIVVLSNIMSCFLLLIWIFQIKTFIFCQSLCSLFYPSVSFTDTSQISNIHAQVRNYSRAVDVKQCKLFCSYILLMLCEFAQKVFGSLKKALMYLYWWSKISFKNKQLLYNYIKQIVQTYNDWHYHFLFSHRIEWVFYIRKQWITQERRWHTPELDNRNVQCRLVQTWWRIAKARTRLGYFVR